jgi:folate-binding Fe-S cluster repair protein YgfZ
VQLPKYIQVPNRKYLDIEGVDAAKFIQGLCTNDMKLLEDGGHDGAGALSASLNSSMATIFLSRQGRIISDAIVYAVPSSRHARPGTDGETEEHPAEAEVHEPKPTAQSTASQVTDAQAHESRRFILEFDGENMNELAQHLLLHRLRAKLTIKAIQLSTIWALTLPGNDTNPQELHKKHILARSEDPRQASWGNRIITYKGISQVV